MPPRTAPAPNSDRNRSALLLPDATIGVVGASQVGRHVIRMLKPFGPRILVYDPYLTPDEALAMEVDKRGDLVELCAECDAVTLHTPVTEDTHHLIGAAELEAMKDDAVFVNSSRGSCVDEQALIGELQKGRLFAFLDVSDPEPTVGDSPLRSLPNVIYTSHISGGPSHRLGKQAVDDIESFLRGQAPLMAVSSDQLGRLA